MGDVSTEFFTLTTPYFFPPDKNSVVIDNKIERISAIIKECKKGLEIDTRAFRDVKRLEKYDSLSFEQLLDWLAGDAAEKSLQHPDWFLLAGRLSLRLLRYKLPKTFFDCMKGVNQKVFIKFLDDFKKECQNEIPEGCIDKIIQYHHMYFRIRNVFALGGNASPDTYKFIEGHKDEIRTMIEGIYDKSYYNFCDKYQNELQEMIVEERDDSLNYFSIRTLISSHLLKNPDGTPAELPCFKDLRIATFLFRDQSGEPFKERESLKDIKKYYDDLSIGYFSGPSPLTYGAGLKRSSVTSCFTSQIEDTMEDIADSWKYAAIISKNTGGFAADLSGLRKSEIGKMGAESKGVIPWARTFDRVFECVDQENRRKGSGAFYISCWHSNFLDVIEAPRPNGNPDLRTKNLFYGLWISDLFMKRVEKGEMWSMFCPKHCRKLVKFYGDEFEKEYERCENLGLAQKKIPARDIWREIYFTHIKIGHPYMMFSDAVNKKSNQKNCGKIRLSNLCTEIVQYTAPDEISSCNLSSISLDEYIIFGDIANVIKYDFEKLGAKMYDLVILVNRMIDRGYYPESIPQIKKSNQRHRNISIGLQGLADVFFIFDCCWGDETSRNLNSAILETMYYFGMKSSIDLAKKDGPYESFAGSPLSQGKFQRDLWEEFGNDKIKGIKKVNSQQLNSQQLNSLSIVSDEMWENLRKDVMKYGARNAHIIGLMPTATTAHIRGKTESFQPISSNIYIRRVLAGSFRLVNKYLHKDLEKLGMWKTDVVKQLIEDKGSCKNLLKFANAEDSVRVNHLMKKYLTTHEINPMTLLEMGADRGKNVCQSQSQDAYLDRPSYQEWTSYQFYAWKLGLKTGMYYLRNKPAADPINFALESFKIEECVGCSM